MNQGKLLSLVTLWYLAFAAAISLVVPIIFIEMDASDVQKVGLILFGIDVLYSLIVGVLIGLTKQPLVYLFFFPIIYLLGVHLFFDNYAYYFGAAYTIFTFLACGAARK